MTLLIQFGICLHLRICQKASTGSCNFDIILKNKHSSKECVDFNREQIKNWLLIIFTDTKYYTF